MESQTFHTFDLINQTEIDSTKVPSTGGCLRCGGFLAPARYIDLLDDTGQLDFVGERCVQCGDVVDPIIRRNRARQQVFQAHGPHTSDKKTESIRRVA